MEESSQSPTSSTRSRAPRTSQMEQSKCHGNPPSNLKQDHPKKKVKLKPKLSSGLKPRECGRKRKLQSVSESPSQVLKINLKKGKSQSGSDHDSHSLDTKLCKAEKENVKSSLDDKEKSSPGSQTRTSCKEYVREILKILKAKQFSKVVDMIKDCISKYKDHSCMELECVMKEATLMGNLFVFHHLLFHGVSPVRTESLHNASEQGHIDIVSYLVKYRENTVNLQDCKGNTALMLCQTNGGASHITQVLIQAQADVNMQNKAGETALMIATRCLNVNAVLYLLKANADTKVKDIEGNTAYSLASTLGIDNLMDALRKFTLDETSTPLVDAVSSHHLDLLQNLLVCEQLDVDGKDKYGDSPITALFNSKLEEIEDLPETNGSAYFISGTPYNFVPFNELEFEMLKVLLNANCYIDHFGRYGSAQMNVPLCMAIDTESMDILELFSKGNFGRLNNSFFFHEAINLTVDKVNRRDILGCLKSFLFYCDEYDFESTLHTFIKQGCPEIVRDIIDCLGFKFDLISAVSVAATCDSYLVFLELIMETEKNKHYQLFKELVVGRHGFSWLSDAVNGDCPELVEHLLKAGADPEFKHDTLGHPLFLCPSKKWYTFNNSKKVSELLVQFGAQPKLLIADHRDLVEQYVLKAIKGGLCGVLEVWINNGLNLDSNHLTCAINLLESPAGLTSEMRQLFLSRISDIDQDYLTLNANFMMAFKQQDEEFVEALLEQGADVNHDLYNTSEYSGSLWLNTYCSALSIAIKSSNISFVRSFIKHGADVNINTSGGTSGQTIGHIGRRSLLVKAVNESTYDIVDLLLENGAFVNGLLEGEKYSFALFDAVNKSKSLELIELLLNKGAEPNVSGIVYNCFFSPILIAAIKYYSTDMRVVQLLVEKGADVNSKTYETSSALALSIELKCFNIAKYLIECGADVNTQDSSGKTALMEAASLNEPEIKESIIPLLIENGAYINSVDDEGNSALKIASDNINFFPLSALLCSSGIDVNLKYRGKTLLTQYLISDPQENPVEKNNREQLAACLLSSGANFVSENMEFLFTVHRCAALGEFNFLNILVQSGEFAPVLMKQTSQFFMNDYCEADDVVVSSLSDVLSPLCIALLCDRKSVAERMIECNYLTISDLTLLPNHQLVREYLRERDYNTIETLNKLGQTPASLLKLSSVKVSDCIGTQLGRKHRITQTGLPRSLQRTLMYQNKGKFVTCQERVKQGAYDDLAHMFLFYGFEFNGQFG